MFVLSINGFNANMGLYVIQCIVTKFNLDKDYIEKRIWYFTIYILIVWFIILLVTFNFIYETYWYSNTSLSVLNFKHQNINFGKTICRVD